VSLNDALLRRVDRIAKSRGLSRSGYLAELAERDAARSEGPGTSRAARGALVRLDDQKATLDVPRFGRPTVARSQLAAIRR